VPRAAGAGGSGSAPSEASSELSEMKLGESLLQDFQTNAAALREEMMELRQSLEIGAAATNPEATIGQYTSIVGDMKARYGGEAAPEAAAAAAPAPGGPAGPPAASPPPVTELERYVEAVLPPAAPAAPTGGGGGAPDLSELNRHLRDNGFGTVDAAGSVPGACLEVLAQYERRGKLIQELMASSDLAQRQEERLEGDVKRMRAERDQARREASQAAGRYESELERSFASERSGSASKKKLQAEKGGWSKKVAQLEHNLRAKDVELQKLKDKLAEKAEREDRRKARDKEIYDKLKRSVARQTAGAASAAVRELRPVEIVGIYEAQRDAAEAELTQLAAENATLKKQAQDQGAFIKNMNEAGGWETPEEGQLLNKISLAESNTARMAAHLAETEAKAAKAQMEADRKLAEADRKQENLAEEIANLIFELEGRPTVRELQSAKRQVEVLEKRLHTQAEELMSEAPPLGEVPENAPVTVRQKMKRDKEIYRLGLHKVEKAPPGALVHVIQDACVRLDIGDMYSLSSAIAKLLRVVAAVPRMEAFIGSVCETVLKDGHPFLPPAVQAAPEPHHIPQALKGWLLKLRKTRALEKLRHVVQEELGRRATKDLSKTDAGIAKCVAHLVDTEQSFFRLHANYTDAQRIMESEPDELLARIVAHFQRVFNCPDLDGVFAAMNHLYMVNAESRNFLQSLKALLGLEKNAGVAACLARVRQLLEIQLKKMPGDEGRSPEEVASMIFASGANFAPKLMEILDLSNPDDILPSVQILADQLAKFEKALPAYQEVVSQLYAELGTETLESIVPAVRQALGTA